MPPKLADASVEETSQPSNPLPTAEPGAGLAAMGHIFSQGFSARTNHEYDWHSCRLQAFERQRLASAGGSACLLRGLGRANSQRGIPTSSRTIITAVPASSCLSLLTPAAVLGARSCGAEYGATAEGPEQRAPPGQGALRAPVGTFYRDTVWKAIVPG